MAISGIALGLMPLAMTNKHFLEKGLTGEGVWYNKSIVYSPFGEKTKEEYNAY